MTRSEIIGQLEHEIGRAVQERDTWLAQVQKDPHRALEWCTTIIHAVTRLRVFEEVLGALKRPEVVVDGVQAYVQSRIRAIGRDVHGSTGPLDSALRAGTLAAWIDADELLRSQ